PQVAEELLEVDVAAVNVEAERFVVSLHPGHANRGLERPARVFGARYLDEKAARVHAQGSGPAHRERSELRVRKLELSPNAVAARLADPNRSPRPDRARERKGNAEDLAERVPVRVRRGDEAEDRLPQVVHAARNIGGESRAVDV